MSSAYQPSREEIEQRKRLVGLTDADTAKIRELGAKLRPRTAELVEVFFEHLAKFPEARALLGQPELLAQARELKRKHLDSMLSGDYGPAYVAERLALGELYAQAALPPRMFIAAFQRVMQELGAASGDPNWYASIGKLASFDVALIVDVIIAERERVIRQQAEAIRELSTPVLQLRDRLLLVPVIGLIDSVRARQLTEDMLHAIHRARARIVVLDVTGVPSVDTRVAHHLFQTVAAAKLMGVQVVVSGLSADISQSLALLGIDARGLQTVADLQSAIEEADRYLARLAAAA